MSKLEDVLARVKQLNEQATPEPWRLSMSGYSVKAREDVIPGVSRIVFGVHPGMHAKARDLEKFQDNAEFAAESRTLLPRLARALGIAVEALQRHYDEGCTPLGLDIAAVEKALAPESEQA